MKQEKGLITTSLEFSIRDILMVIIIRDFIGKF
jgi:hypothetical protein